MSFGAATARTKPAVPDRTLAHLEWESVLEHLSQHAQTEAGAARALRWPLAASAERAAARSEEIQEARELMAEGRHIGLSGVTTLSKLLDRAAKRGVLMPEGLAEVATVLECGAAVRRQLASAREIAPRLARRASAIRPLDDVSGPIRDSFDDAGLLRDEASDDLGALRRRTRGLREEIIQRLKDMMEDPALEKILQDTYYTQRQDRYVLPVKVEMRHMMTGIVHGRSQTEATVFVEPGEITELGNRLKMAVADTELEEARILASLTSYVAEEISTIRSNIEILVELDLIVAAAALAEASGGQPVTVGRTGRLLLRAARHPLMVLSGEKVVPNDFVVEPAGCLVITGPNAGGKTVALKTVGLISLMALAGLHPPCAEGSEVPIYEGLFTSMGDEQDISARLSTFTAHVSNLNSILKQSGPGALTLLDEVAVGTEPSQGAALARAVLEALAESGAQVLVTTHYTALKAMAGEDPRFHNAAMGFDDARMEATFRLEPGALGSSSALTVARTVGLPTPILERAEELMGGQQMKLDGLLAELERKRQAVDKARDEAGEALGKAMEEKERAVMLRKQLSRELDQLRRRAHDDAVQELRGLRVDLERLRKQLRTAPANEMQNVMADAETRATEASERLSELAPPVSEKPGTRPPSDGELSPGIEVTVSSTGALGKVIELGSRGRVTVQVGAVKLKLKTKDLLLFNGTEKKPKPSKPRPGPGSGSPARVAKTAFDSPSGVTDEVFIRDPAATLDLRGMRVDDGLAELDRFLDRMLQQERPAVLIIHGYGTGAMRKAVREELKRSSVVRRQRPGERAEGGDGVTVAFLDV